MKLELTKVEVELVEQALSRAAFREAEIAVDLGLPNTNGKLYMLLRDKVAEQRKGAHESAD